MATSRVARQPDDRGHRRGSGQRRSALRRRPGAPVRPQPRARCVSLHRWRTHVREGAVQRRLHQRQRSAPRLAQSRCPLRDALVPATELHRGPGIRQRRDGDLQVGRRRDDLDPARRGSTVGPAGEHRDRTERSEHPLRHHRARTGTDRLLQIHRRRRALVPADSQPGRAFWIGAGHAATRTHRRRRPADRDRRSQGSARRLHRVDRDVADARWGTHMERRAWRSGWGRLPAHLDQSERHADHSRRLRSGSGGLRESWTKLEQLVQPEHRGDVPRHHRQRVSLSRLLGTTGLRQRVRAKPIG